jgi:parvulin-like peptidyl-prolyl isomerase
MVALVLSGLLLVGCSENKTAPGKANRASSGGVVHPPQANTDEVVEIVQTEEIVARIGDRSITMDELNKPLIDAYGLNVLLNLVQLELARDTAERQGVIVSTNDVAIERERTLARMFKDSAPEDYDSLLAQFMQQQRISAPEFAIVLETNTYLRKIAEPRLAGKVTDENVKEAFLQTYGETVKVRHIQCANLQEIAEAQRRIAAGESFEMVARAVSRNPRTASIGGELPSFSRNTDGLPQAFKDTAFTLQPGQISDPVQAEGAYHLIMLESRVAPKAVNFDDHKELVRADLEDRLMQAAVKELRQQMGQQALQQLKIENPVLNAQFDARKQERDAAIKDREGVRAEIEKQRQRLATQPVETFPLDPATPESASSAPAVATEPAPVPTGAPATQPATAP